MVKIRRKRQEKKRSISCLEAQNMIEPYLGGKLTNEELGLFLDHIGDCRECRDELEVFNTVYQVLGEEDSGTVSFRPLEETLARSKARLARVRRAKRFQAAAMTTAALLAALLVIGICFPDLPFSPVKTSDFFRNIIRERFHRPASLTVAETETSSMDSIPAAEMINIQILETQLSETELSETEIPETEEAAPETMAGTEELITG